MQKNTPKQFITDNNNSCHDKKGFYIMYTENLGKDVYIFSKAFLTNQLAIFTPKLYLKLMNETGRGETEDSAQEIANYFVECFDDYQQQLNFNRKDFQAYLKGKTILEYGPGDVFGVALLFYAYGAERIDCVDRFPLSSMSDTNSAVYKQLIGSLEGEARERAKNAFIDKDNPKKGFKPNTINYTITKNGFSGQKNEYDFIISRAVLEHVNDLENTMLDIKHSLKEDGISLHKVDLKSHGLDRYTPFDFLTWPTLLYKLMYSHKGFPNRYRVDKYKHHAETSNLKITHLEPTQQLTQEQLDRIYSKLTRDFKHISPEELLWMGFWIRLEH